MVATHASAPQAPPARAVADGGLRLFLRRWTRNPLQMGSVVPSSPALGRCIARLVRRRADESVVELGAGTGAVSRALLRSGLPPERLVVVELVPEMADHLRSALRGVRVLCGDAFDLPRLLPARLHGRVGTAICGIPLVLLPFERQQAFVSAVEAARLGRKTRGVDATEHPAGERLALYLSEFHAERRLGRRLKTPNRTA